MLTEKALRNLLIKAQTKPIVIFCPSIISAELLKAKIKTMVAELFPIFVNNYIGTGWDIYLKGHEKLTVITVPIWNELQRNNLSVFKGYSYSYECTENDIAGVKNLMYEPERIEYI